MTEKLSVDQRWNLVLAELPAIGKNRVNQQQGFKFRGVDDVLDKVKPLFGKHGVHVIPVHQACERVTRTTAKGGNLHVCYMTVTWEIRGVDGGSFHAETCGEGTDSGDKATSKAQTMAFKYLLWPSLAVAENEETDADAFTPEESVAAAFPGATEEGHHASNAPDYVPPQRGAAQTLTAAQHKALESIHKARELDFRAMSIARWGKSPELLIKSEASRWLDELNGKVKPPEPSEEGAPF